MSKRTIPFAMTLKGMTTKGRTREIAKLEYEYSGIELKKELAKLDCDSDLDKAMAEIQVEFDEGVIDQTEFDKRSAIANKTPWVEVKKMEVNVEDPKQGYMELDWNDEFVAMLQEKGYTGESDESVVNKWFNDVCRTVLLQEIEDQDYGLESQDDVILVNDNDEE
jgi:hypothetical protein|tara:strand:- start:7438 stop:7932 length:495 start_codon:yes stop_codon:yes gene_type:complete